MAKWMTVFVLGIAILCAGCKSPEEKVKVYDKPSDPMFKPPTSGQTKQPDNMSEGINSNPNIPDAAKKALGTK